MLLRSARNVVMQLSLHSISIVKFKEGCWEFRFLTEDMFSNFAAILTRWIATIFSKKRTSSFYYGKKTQLLKILTIFFEKDKIKENNLIKQIHPIKLYQQIQHT